MQPSTKKRAIPHDSPIVQDCLKAAKQCRGATVQTKGKVSGQLHAFFG